MVLTGPLSPWFQHQHVGEHAHVDTTPTDRLIGRLVLETRCQEDKTIREGRFQLTPAPDADYWSYRVRLTDTQAILGFPKFHTIGIGFALEREDWNSNLPYTCTAEDIYAHIEHNKGDESISRQDCLAAIRMIQTAVHAAKAMRS